MRTTNVLLCLLLLASSAALAQAPTRVTFNARLVDNGTPAQGMKTFLFKLFPTVSGGSEAWMETQMLTVTDGAVSAQLGAVTALTDTIFTGTPLFLEVTIDGVPLTPRTEVVSVPYALRSGVAARVGSLTPLQIQERVSGSCGEGAAIRIINANGSVECQAAGIANDGGTTSITNITAGAGLTGGGATGNVTLAVAFGDGGTATTVSRSDHTHNYLPVGATLTCTSGQQVTGLNANGSVICGADANTTYGVVPNGGLSLNASSQFGLMACSSGQVLKSAGGTAWGCNDDLNTTYTFNAPLSATGTAVSLGVVPVANGGTGANNPATARSNLAAAASGANSDITSLTGLTTRLAPAMGGTGLGAPTNAGQFMKTTAGGYAVGALLASEVPSGSTAYIQNGSAPQAASFNVLGEGRVTADVQNGAGTVALTAGSRTVTGNGTSFSSTVREGDVIRFTGGAGCMSGNDFRHVVAVAGNTSLTMLEPMGATSSSCTYQIIKRNLIAAPASVWTHNETYFDGAGSMHVPWGWHLMHSDSTMNPTHALRMRWNWDGNLGDFVFLGATGAAPAHAANIMSSGFGASTPNHGGSFWGFVNNTAPNGGRGLSTYHMHLSETGNLGIGNYGPGTAIPYKLTVQGDIQTTSGCVRGSTGAMIAGTCSSDERLKKDVAPASPVLERLAQLRVVNYRWRSEQYPELAFGDQVELGVIAQQVERVMPDLVTVDDRGFRRVHFERMPMLLLQGVQELKAREDVQALRLRKLEDENRELKARLDRLERLLSGAPAPSRRR